MLFRNTQFVLNAVSPNVLFYNTHNRLEYTVLNYDCKTIQSLVSSTQVTHQPETERENKKIQIIK